MNRATARVRLKAFGNTAEEPILADPADIELLLDMARLGDWTQSPPGDWYKGPYRTWYSNIALTVGEYILPRVGNSHYYKVTASDGAAGANEPVWPVVSGNSIAADGVTYQEQGAFSWVETYDVNFAISQAWLLKAGRLADRYLFMSGGKMFSRQQFYDHCMALHRKYAMRSPLKAARLGPSDLGGLCVQRVN